MLGLRLVWSSLALLGPAGNLGLDRRCIAKAFCHSLAGSSLSACCTLHVLVLVIVVLSRSFLAARGWCGSCCGIGLSNCKSPRMAAGTAAATSAGIAAAKAAAAAAEAAAASAFWAASNS